MREYTVVHLCFDKKSKLADVYNSIKQLISYKKIFFEVDNIVKNNTLSAVFSDGYFKEYEYAIETIYTGNPDGKITIVSNLDGKWKQENKNISRSLTEEQSNELIDRMNKANIRDFSTFMIGFDEIAWEECNVESGTYGYEKARSNYRHGENYLSNSVILFKDADSPALNAYVSFESKYSDSPILKNVLESCDKIKGTKHYYAPSDSEERKIWEEEYSKAKTMYQTMLDGVNDILTNLPYRIDKYDFNTLMNLPGTIDVKKVSRAIIEPLGWIYEKNEKGEKGTKFVKKSGEVKVTAFIDSLHKGHYLQTLITYESKMFYFNENIDYMYDLYDDEDAKKYFNNLAEILKHIENTLSL